MVTNQESVDQLNSLLRGEISAVESFRQGLDRMKDTAVSNSLRECMTSHSQRIDLLSARIRTLGGVPSTESGLWGSFAKLVAGGAAALGEKATIAALEEGEDKGIRDYKSALDKVDPESRQLIEQQLMPAQQRTHQAISSLKHGLDTTDLKMGTPTRA